MLTRRRNLSTPGPTASREDRLGHATSHQSRGPPARSCPHRFPTASRPTNGCGRRSTPTAPQARRRPRASGRAARPRAQLRCALRAQPPVDRVRGSACRPNFQTGPREMSPPSAQPGRWAQHEVANLRRRPRRLLRFSSNASSSSSPGVRGNTFLGPMHQRDTIEEGTGMMLFRGSGDARPLLQCVSA